MSSGLRVGWMALLAMLTLALACSEAAGPVDSPGPGLAGVTVEVAQGPACECCEEWTEHLRAHGATVTVTGVDDLAAVKASAGIPDELVSCHTAAVAGYTVEGHVPAEAIIELLDRAAPVDGIAVPGMPAGSPGMPGEADGPLVVFAFTGDAVDLYGRY